MSTSKIFLFSILIFRANINECQFSESFAFSTPCSRALVCLCFVWFTRWGSPSTTISSKVTWEIICTCWEYQKMPLSLLKDWTRSSTIWPSFSITKSTPPFGPSTASSAWTRCTWRPRKKSQCLWSKASSWIKQTLREFLCEQIGQTSSRKLRISNALIRNTKFNFPWIAFELTNIVMKLPTYMNRLDCQVFY